ncbi:hypothetical protein AB0442_25515 [Kitasatospora sp. NPDC085895]|uniref:hypothetical protein n=1 Tax=Kitasatospora sp. NPDC085895 TaxID=3155057 RepID=UPI00344FD294
MDDEEFGRALAGRLEAAADARVGAAEVPLAGLRTLGRRRVLRRRGAQAAAAAAVVLAGLLPLLDGGAAGGAAPAATAPAPAPDVTELPDLTCPARLRSGASGAAPIGDSGPDETAERAWRFALREDRFHIAGVCVDRGAGQVLVFRVPGSDLDARLSAALGGAAGTLRFRDAPYSQFDLGRVCTAVVRDTEYWRDRGVEITDVGRLVDGTGIALGTPQADTARADLAARYRPYAVEVVEQPSATG